MTASFGEILPLYHEHCPHVNTQLVEGDTKTLSDMLMHNEVDLIYTLDDMGYDAQRVKLFECPQEIVIVASPKHPVRCRQAAQAGRPRQRAVRAHAAVQQLSPPVRHGAGAPEAVDPAVSGAREHEYGHAAARAQPLPGPCCRATRRAAARKRAGSRSCRSRTATWSSGASWCTTATRCSRRRSAPWSPALRRSRTSHCISRINAAQRYTKTAPIERWGLFAVCEQKLSRSRTAGGRSDALS